MVVVGSVWVTPAGFTVEVIGFGSDGSVTVREWGTPFVHAFGCGVFSGFELVCDPEADRIADEHGYHDERHANCVLCVHHDAACPAHPVECTHEGEARRLAGYGVDDTPCEPRRSAYTSDLRGDGAYVEALVKWGVYSRYMASHSG